METVKEEKNKTREKMASIPPRKKCHRRVSLYICFILYLYKKKATMENIRNNENATETAFAIFLAGFVAVGFAIVTFEPEGDGRF